MVKPPLSSHTSLETQSALDRLGLKNLPQPPYSSDLTPSDFYRFPKFNECPKGNHYESDDKVENGGARS